MATGIRSRFDPFIFHRSALASCLALALLLPAAAVAAPPPPPVPSPGFTITVFAGPLAGSTAPDSIAVVGQHVWVAYGNVGNPDGSGGAMSQIVEYKAGGKVKTILTVTGHNDGLRLDPTTHQLWALQNEDANPNLVLIDPITGFTVKYTFAAPPPHGGGYDDIVFINGAVYLSASAPKTDAKGNSIGPSIVKATLVAASHTVEVTPVVSGTPFADNIPFGTVSRLNLTDPDSMKITPSGEVLLDDQGDGLLVFWPVVSPNAPLRVLPLLGTVQVDDTVFATSRHGVLLVRRSRREHDFRGDTPVWPLDAAYSAAAAVPATKTTPAFPAYVGQLDLTSGAVVPVVTNLVSPHGMAFVGCRDEDRDDPFCLRTR
jgi:hypothetical protein